MLNKVNVMKLLIWIQRVLCLVLTEGRGEEVKQDPSTISTTTRRISISFISLEG